MTDLIQNNADSIAKLQEVVQRGIQEGISISKIDNDTWMKVQTIVKLQCIVVEDLHSSAQNEIAPAFVWDDTTERAQSGRLTPKTFFLCCRACW